MGLCKNWDKNNAAAEGLLKSTGTRDVWSP